MSDRGAQRVYARLAAGALEVFTAPATSYKRAAKIFAALTAESSFIYKRPTATRLGRL
ncbi:hypothetical protein [Halorubrum sp. T3]|uniref:hypothetical protein n=1 Tax=Halorubrum sp. T3 TaxID=1194088 RepID=UPI0012BAEE5B|nr:hypothetical protein [Halorubrum sp. T3]